MTSRWGDTDQSRIKTLESRDYIAYKTTQNKGDNKSDWTANKINDDRRKQIVEDEPPVADVRARWPALFSERQIEAEFARLTSVDLKGSLLAGLDKYLLRCTEPGVGWWS
ncbi:unnamed protein product [Boreogadus saida]